MIRKALGQRNLHTERFTPGRWSRACRPGRRTFRSSHKYDIIPGQVYVKGFIRNYGNYLDLDGDRLVKAYQSQVGDIDTFSLRSVTRQKAQATPNLVQSEFVEYQTSKKRMSLETRQRKRQRSIVQERIILGIILFCMALFLLWLFLF